MDIQVTDLSVRYPDGTLGVDELSCVLPAGRITGVIGRNGSGKTTLLSVLGNLIPPTSGEVLVDGRPVFEDPVTAAATCLVREDGDVPGSDKIDEVLEFIAALRVGFDLDLAHDILATFGVSTSKTPDALSRGQSSALGIAVGLASRAPLTMLDEVYLGLDAPSRYAFYDLLLEDYAAHPRTILLSSHLIEEVGRVFEDVLIIDRGRVLLHGAADDLRARGATVTGPADLVDLFVSDLEVVDERRLGATKAATTIGVLDADRRRQADDLGLELTAVPLQDLFVHLTSSEETIT